MVLPSGTELPPPQHGVLVVVALVAVGGLLWRARPRVDDALVGALAPWMATGAALYVVYRLGLAPDPVAPLFSSPTVYLSTAAVAGFVWLLAVRSTVNVPRVLTITGSLTFLLPAMYVLGHAVIRGTLHPWPSVAAVVGATVVVATVWTGLRRVRPRTTSATGVVGVLVIFGHALDGVSTAIGIDLLSVAEQTPLSRLVIEAGHALPTDPYIGGAWLFALLKVGLATALVVLFTGYVREDPAEGYLVLGLVTAFGMGPGIHNVLLFALGSMAA